MGLHKTECSAVFVAGVSWLHLNYTFVAVKQGNTVVVDRLCHHNFENKHSKQKKITLELVIDVYKTNAYYSCMRRSGYLCLSLIQVLNSLL